MDASFWKFLTSIAIAISPVMLHVFDKFLELFSPITRTTLVSLMRADKRVSEAVKSETLFETIEGYFNFERTSHFVFALTIFNILSLFFAQAACTGHFLIFTPITLILIVLLLVFLGAFFISLCNRIIDPAAVHGKKWWRRPRLIPRLIKGWRLMAFIWFGIVIITDIALHFSCEHAEGAAH